MRCAVRYYSRGGNTERVARAIAGELETDAYTTDTPLKEYADVLLVGSGMYAGHIRIVPEAIEFFHIPAS